MLLDIIGAVIFFTLGFLINKEYTRRNSAHGVFYLAEVADENAAIGIKFDSHITERTKTIILTKRDEN